MDSAEDNFLEKKGRGAQNQWRHCCRTAYMWESDTSTAKDTVTLGTGRVRTGTADKRSLASESKVGFQWRDFNETLKGVGKRS